MSIFVFTDNTRSNPGSNGYALASATVPVIQPVVENGLPGMVPIISTAPSPDPNQLTGTPTPANVQNDPAASTVVTSAGIGTALVDEVLSIVTNPTQHIIGVIVLLVIAWFVWKHFK
ncbi:MAG TPA: hypothetical protein VFB79_21395 [Candidatus Angelobacter sp.]|nr:hypothetical protein [Candidatus Angelobacter sp.]